MFVGYTEHHSRDEYRMLNLTTSSIINSRNIIRLNKIYKEWKNAKTIISAFEEETMELPTGISKMKLTTNASKDTEDESNKLDMKVFRAMKKLESRFTSQPNRAVEDYNYEREITSDQVN
jgi:hypothetical protein